MEIAEALKVKKVRKSYKYAVLLSLLMGGIFMYLQAPHAADPYIADPNVVRSYSNAIISGWNQDLLMKEKCRLNQHLVYFRTDSLQLRQDSLKVWKSLKKALHNEFPTTELKQSAGYKKSLFTLQEEIDREMWRIRQKL